MILHKTFLQCFNHQSLDEEHADMLRAAACLLAAAAVKKVRA